MAIGPFARILAQVVVPVVAVIARALPTAYAEALANARRAGMSNDTVVQQALRRTRVSKQEALQILNLNEAEATAEAVQKQFDRYMRANEVKDGSGSFYLQSKVYRARESLEEFLKEQRLKDKQAKQ